MPLIPLLPLFHFFNTEYFEETLTDGIKPLVAVRWSDGKLRKTAGFYRTISKGIFQKDAEIVLSQPLLQHLPKSAIESTLCHEMIHAWIDLILCIKEGHGFNFHQQMKIINASQDEFEITVRHNFPVPRSMPRWRAICPCCSMTYLYLRKVKGAACKKCCNQFHKGQWHVSCLLSYQPFA